MILQNSDNKITNSDKISAHLSALAQKLNISAVILVNSAGQIISSYTSSSWNFNTLSIAVLSSSTYAAANEMAKLISERGNFLTVLHEGTNYNILTSAVSSSYFLVVVFPKTTTLGLVRIFTKKTVENLYPVLQAENSNVRQQQNELDEHFQNLLSDELDRVFNGL
ncbi:hypothetical protein DRQ07_06635 [candidate division KSB1 bacterium]|nr:MAG: hypothetical protein DRQ07_06635 [candidate division KSB1 bacterium]